MNTKKGETMYDLLIKNGKIVTSDEVADGMIAVKGEKIAAILAPDSEVEAKKRLMQKENMSFRGQSIHMHI